jgi:hypothetical protein
MAAKMRGYDEILAENAVLKRKIAVMEKEMKELRTSRPGQPLVNKTTTTPAIRPQPVS